MCSNDIIHCSTKVRKSATGLLMKQNCVFTIAQVTSPGAAGDGSDEWYISVTTSSTWVSVIIRAFVMVQECVANICTFTLQFFINKYSEIIMV